MIWKRCLATGAFAVALCLVSQAARAQEPAPPKKDEAPAAPKEAPKKKEPFFGNHFALFLEVRGGAASFEAVKNPINNGSLLRSENELNFDGNKFGRFDVGWTLPRGRGQYLVSYTGIADGNYTLDASGSQQDVQSSTGTPLIVTFLAPWWRVHVNNGMLTSTQTPPVWSTADDANGNGVPDPGEVRFPTTTVSVAGSVPADAGNRIQTWDLLYRREFGGVKINARWSAGIRYLRMEGALPTPDFLKGVIADPTFGYSDGLINHFLLMQQDTTGFGPTGSGEVRFNFFRQRLTLYGEVRAAFLDQKLKTNSGGFTYFAPDPTSNSLFLPGNGDISQSINKTAWNLGFEVGVKVRLLQGFHLIVDWNRTGYLDSLLIPTQISIPQNATQVSLGTTALFISRDLVISTLNLGLSFQF